MVKTRAIRSLVPPLFVAAVLAVSFLAPPQSTINGVFACAGYGYLCGAPTVTNVNPNVGPMAGGTAVTITGTNFNNTSVVVHFGSALATSVVVVSDTSITANSPASASPGTVNVQVTTPAGSSANTANNQFTFQQPGPCTGAGITADLASPQPSGTTITFTATSSSCTNPEYLFYVQATGLGGPWLLGRTYGGPTYAWNTVGNGVTSYTIDVWVRQTGHTAAEESFALMSFTLSATPACTAAGVAPDKASPQQSGTIITFTATSSSCPNPQYLFYFQAAGGPWILGRGYGGPTYVWNTAGNGATTYSVDVWVRQTGTTVAQQSFSLISYTLTAPVACTTGGIVADMTSPQATGTTITFTGSSAGCSQPMYLYYFQASGGPWLIGRTYGAASFAWHTTGNGKTTYTVVVWVHQNGSSAPHETFAFMTFVLN